MSCGELSPGSLRVLIVDRHEVSRAAIRALLRTEGLEVVADVATAEEALALADTLKVDVVIVDVGNQEARALELAGSLVRLTPSVVLTSSAPADPNGNGHPFVPKPDICARELRRATATQRNAEQGDKS